MTLEPFVYFSVYIAVDCLGCKVTVISGIHEVDRIKRMVVASWDFEDRLMSHNKETGREWMIWSTRTIHLTLNLKVKWQTRATMLRLDLCLIARICVCVCVLELSLLLCAAAPNSHICLARAHAQVIKRFYDLWAARHWPLTCHVRALSAASPRALSMAQDCCSVPARFHGR